MSVKTGDRLYFRERLHRARAQSVLALAATNAVIARRKNHDIGMNPGDVATIEQEIDQLVAEQESATLVSINGALQLLRRCPELYGVCEKCGESIPPKRLEGEPWTSRCDAHAQETVQWAPPLTRRLQ